MNKSALVILHEGFEEMEAVAPIDILRRGDVSVTVASLGTDLLVTGRSGITLKADTSLDQALVRDYDAIVLPGGPGVLQSLRHDARVRRAIQHQAAIGKRVAAICAAPLTLLDAGLLDGKQHTAHFTTQEELPQLDPNAAVVRDGEITTSQGAGTATAFALSVLADLAGQDVADEVAQSICLLTAQ